MIFRKKKYYFNPATLSFEEIKINKPRRIFLISIFIISTIIITVASGFILNSLLESPESKILEMKVQAKNGELEILFDKVRDFSKTLKNNFFAKDNTYRVILQMDTLGYSLRTAGTGGSVQENGLLRNSDLTYRVNSMINALNNQLQIQSGSLNVLYEKALDYSKAIKHKPAIIPVSECDLIMISSDFGTRLDPFFFIESRHCGIDFVAQTGKNVFATGEGFVTFVEYSRKGYGFEIIVDHGFGFKSRYGHLNEIKVKEGQKVNRGQIIGTVGQTGRATGPHLHYEVLYNNIPVNPSCYFDTSLTQEEYAQIIKKGNKGIF